MAAYMTRCPSCGKYRRTSSSGRVNCFSCGKSFDAKKHFIGENAYRKSMDKTIDFE